MMQNGAIERAISQATGMVTLTTGERPFPALWPWHAALVVVLAGLDLCLFLAFRHLASAVVPVPAPVLASCLIGGTVCGLVALALWRSQRIWAQTLAVVVCGVPPILADLLVTRYALADPLVFNDSAVSWVPLLLFVTAATLLTAVLPLLMDEPRRAISGLAIVFAVCAIALSMTVAPGAAGTATFPTSPASTTLGAVVALLDGVAGWLLCVVVIAALGVSWLRAEVRTWRGARVALWGDVLWSGAIRPVAILCALVAVLTALPVVLPRVPAFEHAWQSLDPLHGGTFPGAQLGGAPALEPGATLPLNAGAPPAGNTLILRYQVQSDTTGETLAPPLIVATLERFDGLAWSPDPTLRAVAAPALAAPTSTSGTSGTVTARITLVTPLPGNYLVGPDTPLSYNGVPGGTIADISAPGGTLGTNGWQAGRPLQAGASYIVSSAILSPGDAAAAPAVAAASVPVESLALPSTMPTDLRTLMERDAADWAAGTARSATPAAKALAIANALRAGFRLDTADPTTPAAPWAALRAFFATGRGNAYVWVTAHALLCRMAGVPARIVEGFEPGGLDFTSGDRLVRARDFTLYVQVATALGWARIGVLDAVHSVIRAVPVPTPIGGAKPHPTPTPKGAQSAAPPPVQTTPPPPLHLPSLSAAAARDLALLLVALLCLGLAGLAARRLRQRRRSPHQQAAHLLRALVRPAIRAGVPVRQGDTALSFAGRLTALLPETIGQDIAALARAYTQSVYAPPSAPSAFVPLDGALLARAKWATHVAQTVLRRRVHHAHHVHQSHTPKE